jgi:hypothetical protein
MFAEFVNIKMLGNGKYQLTTPDKKNSYFTYQKNKLVMMEVETPAGKVITKRFNLLYRNLVLPQLGLFHRSPMNFWRL